MDNKLEQLFHVVDLMTETERIMRDFYALGARMFPDFEELLSSLSTEEEQHAKLFEEIREAIAKSPEEWELGRFSAKTIEVCNNNLRENIAEIETGKVSPKYALTLICSVEQSMIERHAAKALRCSNDNLRNKLEIITNGFDGHYKRLKKVIDTYFPSTDPLASLNP